MTHPAQTTEAPDARIKRLTMRSWRRGMKEMDLILGPYADGHLAAMGENALVLYDAMLAENDQDLYAWITGAAPTPAPARFAALIEVIGAFARDRHTPRTDRAQG